MLREETVFGPIFSRRLGSSLGINLLPQQGKICNFDCVYCECGWNKDGLGDTVLPSTQDVRKALEAKLRACVESQTPIDSITFSGDGEPTLNPDFPEIVDVTLALRDQYYPKARVSVLSNATRCGMKDLERFEGNFVLQTMFLRGPGWATEEWAEDWMKIVRKVRPREVMVYTIDRETPMAGLRKYTADEMRCLVQPLIDEGFKVQIKG